MYFSTEHRGQIVGHFSKTFLLLVVCHLFLLDGVLSFSVVPVHFSSNRLKRNGQILKSRHSKVVTKLNNNNDDDDEYLFQELFDLNKSDEDFHDLASIISDVRKLESTHHDQFPTYTSSPETTPDEKLKPSLTLRPEEIVGYIMSIFAATGNDDDAVDDALENAFQFTSVQETLHNWSSIPKVPTPTVRKSWKCGKPTDEMNVYSAMESTTMNADLLYVEDLPPHRQQQQQQKQQQQRNHEGLNEPDFGRELMKDYSFLMGCDSYRFVSTPVYDDTPTTDTINDSTTTSNTNLCYMDVVVEKVDCATTKSGKFYDKGVRTINIARSFRFHLERSISAAYCQDMWMVYNVERIGFVFHNDSKQGVPVNDSNLL
jgi:hypothetical protein